MEGIAVFTWEICKRITQQHPEDQFYFFFDRKPDPSFILSNNVQAVVIKPQTRHHLLWKYWFDYALPRAFKKYKIDVFFSPESYLSLTTKVPTLMVTHDLCFLHYPNDYKSAHLNYLKKHGPLFHERANHVVAVSESTKQDIIAQYDLDSSKITVAYNAARDIFKPLTNSKQKKIKETLTNNSPYIVYVGSVHPRKNIVRLIRSFAVLQKSYPSDHQLILFGRWVFGYSECQELIANSEYKDRIILYGDDDCLVEDIIGAADCLVYPSLYEGFGIPIVEAMACGVPVVTSDRGAMKEVGGELAVFVDPESEDSIAQGIQKALLVDLLQYKHDALMRLKQFSWDTSASIIYQLIRSIK